MGGGDLNMKKSWHPLLLKNQERVWLEEKKALEEKKKLDQLRKEKEEERQLQELQRLQEEQTGKKRQEKLEWMYTTPATGSNQNANDLEDYLLGKKRVDKILTADENEKVGAAHKNFIATQYANTVRDTAAKIREDPLFAIKQKEQAAYQALMSNPLRLREMQERTGIKNKKNKKDKKDKKEKKHKDKHRERSASPYDDRHRSDARDHYSRSRPSPSPHERRSLSPPPFRTRYGDSYMRAPDDIHYPSRRGRSRSRTPDSYRRRDRSRSEERRRDDGRAVRTWPRSDESDDNAYDRRRLRESLDDRKRARSRSRSLTRYDAAPSKRSRLSPPPTSKPTGYSAEDRAARLAAMSSDAMTLTVERKERLTLLLAQEKAEAEAEERVRTKSKGMGSFLSHEQKKVFGGEGGIEERIRRGRGQMRVEAD
ncbi:uncharacterized protein LAESUDRAFT_661888 [Laetiporus sulphureus 93-53]|uniref:CBF1-interacting co-repressor CIR N-terminal domain-containing protein n=1 Tax=Laetiporus sulphureus 93-53 TaxID=1314785 RepID=A0A165CAL1_9APHY|nr:uncharacterized protein LAESUDRAFT_661888 [Laetiporus sulphureus 93-53]KZT02467.1 hypothetical protein LAESUDRAFT_661888 [Laetiporus sulphureus 93-53]